MHPKDKGTKERRYIHAIGKKITLNLIDIIYLLKHYIQ